MGNWLSDGSKPIIISGPCSAETQSQVLETANQLAETKAVDILRAGIWKPRTRPGSFEGVGEIGLKWLTEAKEQTGLPLTVEVATTNHVELCLDHNIDFLWIGARTSTNPFAVQEIANALKGTGIPVFFKNPINPDLALWLGGIERLYRAGIEKIGSIHRGFSNYGEKFYRNKPQWQIAIEFKNELPDVPLLCDPSHICGRRDILFEVAQKAIDLGYDGLMIESHINPDDAWSDAKQQIRPNTLKKLLADLVLRKGKEEDINTQSQLELMRQQINKIDEEVFDLLSNRMRIAREIGGFKKMKHITILQQRRWNLLIEKGKIYAQANGLSEEFMVNFLQNIHDESINQQAKVMNIDRSEFS